MFVVMLSLREWSYNNVLSLMHKKRKAKKRTKLQSDSEDEYMLSINKHTSKKHKQRYMKKKGVKNGDGILV